MPAQSFWMSAPQSLRIYSFWDMESCWAETPETAAKETMRVIAYFFIFGTFSLLGEGNSLSRGKSTHDGS